MNRYEISWQGMSEDELITAYKKDVSSMLAGLSLEELKALALGEKPDHLQAILFELEYHPQSISPAELIGEAIAKR